MTEGLAFRDVEVRTWPERADLVVIDVARATVLAHYPLDDDHPAGPIFDPLEPYEDRAQAAIGALERDQDYLRAHFAEATNTRVKLRAIKEPRDRWRKLLAEYEIDSVSLVNADSLIASFEGMPPEKLFALLCDWHDVVERHYPAGSSLVDEGSWVHRAGPSGSTQFHYLAGGDEEEAYRIFRELIDVPLGDFNLGILMRWVYFHRAEFPDRADRFPLRALSALRIEPVGES